MQTPHAYETGKVVPHTLCLHHIRNLFDTSLITESEAGLTSRRPQRHR